MIDWLRDDAAPPRLVLAGRDVPVVLTRHARARRLTLRLAPDGGAVRITLPRWCPRSEALAFAAARTAWLEAQLARVPPPGDPVARGTVHYRGTELPIAWQADSPRQPQLAGGVLRLGGPCSAVAVRLQRWLEGQAAQLLCADVQEYCAVADLPVPAVRLSRARRRWGSCSTTGTVRINWRLVMAPDFVRRSVAAHEVAHLLHFDHSARFHACLSRLYGGPVAPADAWLRAHGRALYADFG